MPEPIGEIVVERTEQPVYDNVVEEVAVDSTKDGEAEAEGDAETQKYKARPDIADHDHEANESVGLVVAASVIWGLVILMILALLVQFCRVKTGKK